MTPRTLTSKLQIFNQKSALNIATFLDLGIIIILLSYDMGRVIRQVRAFTPKVNLLLHDQHPFPSPNQFPQYFKYYFLLDSISEESISVQFRSKVF